jgi:hypothetical protein
MTVCGGFSLGSAALGGSIVQLCTDCKPNLIVEKLQGLDNIGNIDNGYMNQIQGITI